MVQETRNIHEGNIVNGITEVARAISEGFYIRNTMAGYPINLPYCFIVAMTNGEPPVPRRVVDTSKDTLVVEGYDLFEWLLDLQDVLLAGYELVVHTISVDLYKAVTVQRAVAAKATPKVEEKEPQLASEEVTELAVKPARKSKPKKESTK